MLHFLLLFKANFKPFRSDLAFIFELLNRALVEIIWHFLPWQLFGLHFPKLG
jgi:hypothetical protein